VFVCVCMCVSESLFGFVSMRAVCLCLCRKGLLCVHVVRTGECVRQCTATARLRQLEPFFHLPFVLLLKESASLPASRHASRPHAPRPAHPFCSFPPAAATCCHTRLCDCMHACARCIIVRVRACVWYLCEGDSAHVRMATERRDRIHFRVVTDDRRTPAGAGALAAAACTSCATGTYSSGVGVTSRARSASACCACACYSALCVGARGTAATFARFPDASVLAI
jgi:hypothetical protein